MYITDSDSYWTFIMPANATHTLPFIGVLVIYPFIFILPSFVTPLTNPLKSGAQTPHTASDAANTVFPGIAKVPIPLTNSKLKLLL